MGGICSSGPAPEETASSPQEHSKPTEQSEQPQAEAIATKAAGSPPSSDDAEAAAGLPDDAKQADEETENGPESDTDSDVDDFLLYERKVNIKVLENADELDEQFGIAAKGAEDDLFATADVSDEKQEFMAVKPWKGAIVAPSDAPENNPEMPEADLQLEWAYGYRSSGSRMNTFFTPNGLIVYPTAGIVVIYDPVNHTQRYFRGHNDDVICIAQHPTQPHIFASGQVATIENNRAQLPYICVWDSNTGEIIVKLHKAHKRAVTSLHFSQDGKMLVSVGADNDFTMKIWEWETPRCLTQTGTDQVPHVVSYVVWGGEDDNTIITVGKRHMYFFYYDRASNSIKKKRPSLSPTKQYSFKAQSYVGVCFTRKHMAAVACKDGSLYFFKDHKAVRSQKVHNGACMAVCKYELSEQQSGLISGGKDGLVNVYDKDMDVLQSIDVKAPVCSLAVSAGKLVIGTTRAAIWTCENFTQQNEAVKLFEAHSDGELWGLDVHPDGAEERIVTVGEDNKIILWDTTKHSCVIVGEIDSEQKKRRKRTKAATTSSEPENRCARSVCFSNDTAHIAVGTNEGSVVFFESLTLKRAEDTKPINLNELGKQNIARKNGNWIQTLKYSPDGNVLAVGTHGIIIALCDVHDGYKPKGVLKAHNAALTHLDWSADSKFLQANDVAYELLFHRVDQEDLKSSSQEKSATLLKDVKWNSQTCTLGWSVQGVFDKSQDGTDVNSCDRSPDGTLIATGDDYGHVRLFRYPCLDNSNGKRVHGGHASHVMNVRFSADGKHLFSVGGGDQTLLQWKVV